MKTYDDFVNDLVELFEDMEDFEQIELHNEYCDNINDSDNRIIDMWDFDEYMNYNTPSEIAQLIYNGEFNPNDDYFKFDAYGNLESFDSWNVPEYVDFNEIATYCIDNEEDFGNNAIAYIINEHIESIAEEEEEEEEEEENELHYMNAELYGGVVC